ncbi:PREDICTED: galectin-8-like isoform X3 [Branchiostoma belcheri]|uniref:Galectin n=1 Tax=Branchiostoma belcheri TaxID=7741 RepID=A0A6P4YS91_BRABE|nr:PREDICTED: galectin-8-like isoform X3 [Branchiostoma belcheri]
MAYPGFGGMQAPVVNPGIPYIGEIQGGLQPGKMITIQGFVIPGADSRFHVNLQCGASTQPRADIAMHFNPRVMAGVVVRNCLQNQAWGGEEKQHGPFPFAMGQNFEMIILTEPDKFKVAVNGQHFIEFRHRIPFQRVNTLAIDGKVQIQAIRFDSGMPGAPQAQKGGAPVFNPFPQVPGSLAAPPAPMVPPGPMAPPGAHPSSGPHALQVPYIGSIAGGMYPGRMVIINGTVHPGAPDRFHFNLQCGASTAPRADIALQFNPRFAARAVVRNSLINNGWGGEEKDTPYFPFMPGQPFELMVLCQQDSFKVAVNGQHFTEFRHRIQPLTRVDTLVVEGKVSLQQIRFT